MCGKKKTNKLKILIFSLFQGKKSWNLKCKLKYSPSIALCKKRNIFWFQEKKIFWDLKISAREQFIFSFLLKIVV